MHAESNRIFCVSRVRRAAFSCHIHDQRVYTGEDPMAGVDATADLSALRRQVEPTIERSRPRCGMCIAGSQAAGMPMATTSTNVLYDEVVDPVQRQR